MRILVVDDHPLMANAAKLALQGLDHGAAVDLAEALHQALEMAGQPPGYELCLLDLGLPDVNGIEALLQLRAAFPELPVVVLSGHADRARILAALDAGAMGYIPKSSSISVMMNAIRLVMSGAVYVPAEALEIRAEALPPATQLIPEVVSSSAPPEGRDSAPASFPGPASVHGASATPGAAAGPGAAALSTPAGVDGERGAADMSAQLGLSARQTEVLELLLKGLPNKLIARRLDISDNTVKIHVSSVLRALGVNSRTQALLAAHRLGLRLNEMT
jgi:DNA-binding NarL/FixJ family response regulator